MNRDEFKVLPGAKPLAKLGEMETIKEWCLVGIIVGPVVWWFT